MQQSGFGQPLQDFGQRLRRDAVGVSHIFCAAGSSVGVLGQMLHRHQRVIRLFGELEHLDPDFLLMRYPTNTVG